MQVSSLATEMWRRRSDQRLTLRKLLERHVIMTGAQE
jgi:hypothetical protein